MDTDEQADTRAPTATTSTTTTAPGSPIRTPLEDSDARPPRWIRAQNG
jgi:hypothetical protein